MVSDYNYKAEAVSVTDTPWHVIMTVIPVKQFCRTKNSFV